MRLERTLRSGGDSKLALRHIFRSLDGDDDENENGEVWLLPGGKSRAIYSPVDYFTASAAAAADIPARVPGTND